MTLTTALTVRSQPVAPRTSTALSLALLTCCALFSGTAALADSQPSLETLLLDPTFEHAFIDALRRQIDTSRERAANGQVNVDIALDALRRDPELAAALEHRLADIAADQVAEVQLAGAEPLATRPEAGLGTLLLDRGFEDAFVDALQRRIELNRELAEYGEDDLDVSLGALVHDPELSDALDLRLDDIEAQRGPTLIFDYEVASSDIAGRDLSSATSILKTDLLPIKTGIYSNQLDIEGRRLPPFSPVADSGLIGDLEIAATTRDSNRIYWFCPEDCLEDHMQCEAEIGVMPKGLDHSTLKDIGDLASLAGVSVTSPGTFLASLGVAPLPGASNVLVALLQKWRQHGVTVWTRTTSETCERTSCFGYWTQLEYVNRDSGWKKCQDIYPYSPKQLAKVAEACELKALKDFCG